MKLRAAAFGLLLPAAVALSQCAPPQATDHRLNTLDDCGGTGAIVTWPVLDAGCVTNDLSIRFLPGQDPDQVATVIQMMGCEQSDVGPVGDNDHAWGIHCTNRVVAAGRFLVTNG